MPITRCFLLASSLARLIEKERGGHRVTEGYFPDQPGGPPMCGWRKGSAASSWSGISPASPWRNTALPATRRRLCSIWRKVALHIGAFS